MSIRGKKTISANADRKTWGHIKILFWEVSETIHKNTYEILKKFLRSKVRLSLTVILIF
jgi:hypothetical protein